MPGSDQEVKDAAKAVNTVPELRPDSHDREAMYLMTMNTLRLAELSRRLAEMTESHFRESNSRINSPELADPIPCAIKFNKDGSVEKGSVLT